MSVSGYCNVVYLINENLVPGITQSPPERLVSYRLTRLEIPPTGNGDRDGLAIVSRDEDSGLVFHGWVRKRATKDVSSWPLLEMLFDGGKEIQVALLRSRNTDGGIDQNGNI